MRSFVLLMVTAVHHDHTDMSDSQTWDVACNVCGFKLGSNKKECGKAKDGKKAVKFPPCIWAHTDEKYVRRAHAVAEEKRKNDEEKEQEAREAYARYLKGDMEFTEDNTGGVHYNAQDRVVGVVLGGQG